MSAPLRLFLCGDVMTGRGIDQILPHPSEPTLHESAVKDARGYVRIAEDAHGPIPRAVDFRYVWGDALAEMRERRPDVRFAVLETAVTTSADWVPKGINYRMHPENVGVITAAIDGVTLANNHVLDWGPAGLLETLRTLDQAGVKTAGAGRNLAEAKAPAAFQVGERRVLVHAFGSPTAGVPLAWAATVDRPGVNVLEDLSEATLRRIGAEVRAGRRAGTIVVASIHWGPNWGYEIPAEQRSFARALVESASVDVVHGHSSHHVKGIEVHRGRPIFYGCGDLLNDYEGIGGNEEYRPDLSLMYFVDLDPTTGALVELCMVPMQIERFRLHRVSAADARWMRETISRIGEPLGSRAELGSDGALRLRWRDHESRNRARRSPEP